MDEILQKLVDTDILSESTKEEVTTKLSEAIEKRVREGVKTASKLHKEELKEQFKAEQEQLVENLESFLKENMKGALAKSIRKEFQEKFDTEKDRIVEGLGAFLEVQMEKVKPVKESKEDVAAKAFYSLVKEQFLDEQAIDSKSQTIINKLKESLKESKEELSTVYHKLAEARKKDEKRILEGKVSETLKLIPESKRGVAKRLLEGVSLEEFDDTANTIIDELVESDVSDSKTEKKHTEQVVESVKHDEKKFDEKAYLAALAGK